VIFKKVLLVLLLTSDKMRLEVLPSGMKHQHAEQVNSSTHYSLLQTIITN